MTTIKTNNDTVKKTNNIRIDSQQLFQGQTEINITHDEQVYRLRITRQNKLILTK